MKLIKPHIPVHPKLDALEFIIMEKDWFQEKIKLKDGTKILNPKYKSLAMDENSLLNPDSPDCILNKEEVYIVWGLKELFDYIRRLGTANGKYYIGDTRFFYNSAYEAKYVYCNKAKFYFINTGDNIHLDQRVDRIFTGELDDVPVMKNYRFIDLTMVDEYFKYYGSLIDSGYKARFGFDFETNKFPLFEDFFITGFAIACDELTTWFDFRYPLDASEELKAHAYESFKNFVEKYQRRLWAYNVSFEMTVLYQLFGKKYELQDSRAVLICEGWNWGSLKVNAMKFLGIRGWTEGEATFRAHAQVIFNSFTNFDEFEVWMEGKNPDKKVPKGVTDSYMWILEHDPDWGLFKKYWGYQWAVVPTRMLGYYCCLDSFYTVKLADKYYPKYLISYPTFINNARLGFELGLSGIRINEEVLKKTKKNMLALVNSSRIFIDQFMFQNLIWFYEKKNKPFDLNENFKLGVQRYGTNILSPQLNRLFLSNFIKDNLVTFDEDKAIEYFCGDLELVKKFKSLMDPIDASYTPTKCYRQINFMKDVTSLLEEFYHIKGEIYRYNKQWNLTSDFFQVRDYLNNYRESMSEAIFGDDRRFINWDKYDKLYELCIKAEIVDREFILKCRDLMLCDNNIDAKRVIDALRNNRNKVDFHLRVTIPDEHSWDYIPNFFDAVANALRTEREDRSELNKIFVNFADIVNMLHNKNELAKYDEMEEITVLDRPEMVTYNGMKVPLSSLGSKFAYGSPTIKNLIAELMYSNYEDELRFVPMRNGKWCKSEGLPKPEKEEWIRTNSEGVEEYFLKPTIDEHIELRKTCPAYKAITDEFKYGGKIKGMCTGYLTLLYSLGGYDQRRQFITLKSYPNKWQHLIILSHMYTYQGGVMKELSGYITGKQQGIENRIEGVSKMVGLAEMHALRKEDIKYWAYYPTWCINEKSTKRWSSGFHTFVPHSDSMRVFEVSREPGDEEIAIYFDINGAEIRSIAYTCEDPVASAIFESGKDFYLEVVKSAYPDRDEKFWKSQRKAWKSAVLGIFYGIGDGSIADTYDMTMDQVAIIRETLMGKLDMIKKTIKASEEYCAKHGEILTVMGDKMYGEAYRAHTIGFNMRIQSFSAVALADAFYTNVSCLNACGYPTNIRVVVHDSNTIVCKIRDLFKVVYGIEKYYKQYFQKVYHMTYKYDLVLHINLRDPIQFKYNLETKECELVIEDCYGTYLYDTICKYYDVELIDHQYRPLEQYSTDCIMEDYDFKGHKYYCDSDYKWPGKHIYKFKILNPIEELTEMVNKVGFNEIFYKDRDENTILKPTVVINE